MSMLFRAVFLCCFGEFVLATIQNGSCLDPSAISGCTSGDVRVQAISSSIANCTEGQIITGDFTFSVSSTASDRYDVGFYIQQSTSSTSCYAADLTLGDPNVFDLNVNGCGDIKQNVVVDTVLQGLNIECTGDGTHSLVIQGCVVWTNKASNTCNNPTDTAPGTPSKCNCLGISAPTVPVMTRAPTIAPSRSPSYHPATVSPTTKNPTTQSPTTQSPTTTNPTTRNPTTVSPTTANPTTTNPTTQNPTTQSPTTQNPTTRNPTSKSPTQSPTSGPTKNPTTRNPTTSNPTTNNPTTKNPTTKNPTKNPTTTNPTTSNPTTANPTTTNPTTTNPTTGSPTASPTASPTPKHCERMLIQYCNIEPSDPNAYTPVEGTGQFLGEKPTNSTSGPYVVKGFRFEQDGDCVYMDAFDWEVTYFGDFQALDAQAGTLNAPDEWVQGKYWTFAYDAQNNQYVVTFTGFTVPQNTYILGPVARGNFSICVAGGGTELAFKFAKSTSPFVTVDMPSSPYYVDLGIDVPTNKYRFPFDLMNFTETKLNPAVLVNKTTQDCTKNQTEIGTLRNTGDCIYIDMTLFPPPDFFALGVWSSDGLNITNFTERNCANYLNQQAIFWDGVNTELHICPGYTPTFHVNNTETTCYFFQDGVGFYTAFVGAPLTQISICKSACGFDLSFDGCSRPITTSINSYGDLALHAVSTELCNAYEPSDETDSAFSSSCTFADTPAPTTGFPTTRFPTPHPSPTAPFSRRPTAAPTGIPTKNPVTHSPTKAPSRKPTRSPTTGKPTASPTVRPTLAPSKAPGATGGVRTSEPTEAPSTSSPSFNPTPSPVTKSPTHKPTTRHPTRKPTTNPTSRVPTQHPTTKSPTKFPTTYHPTNKGDTRNPTTRAPTRIPTQRPSTGKPTKKPTTSPTTRAPTHQPTKPTARPTKSPSTHPSHQPTHRPTKKPTHRPTTKPTARPTRSPTTHKPTLPTRSPTSRPSSP